jgi:hypothetical protein
MGRFLILWICEVAAVKRATLTWFTGRFVFGSTSLDRVGRLLSGLMIGWSLVRSQPGPPNFEPSEITIPRCRAFGPRTWL